MRREPDPAAALDPADLAQTMEARIEAGLATVERRLREAPAFDPRPGITNGSKVAWPGPAMLSREDGLLAICRALAEQGVPWEWMHTRVGLGRWLYAPPHPLTEGLLRWTVDLAVIDPAALLANPLPDTTGDLRFSAFIEFTYLDDGWKLRGAPPPHNALHGLEFDCEKLLSALRTGVCHLGYAVAAVACDYEIEPNVRERWEARHPGLRLRFLDLY
jgi:hypothetical protein